MYIKVTFHLNKGPNMIDVRCILHRLAVLLTVGLTLGISTGCTSTKQVESANNSNAVTTEDIVGVWAYMGDTFEGRGTIGPGKMVILERGDDVAAFLRRDGAIQYTRFEVRMQGERLILTTRSGLFQIETRLDEEGYLRGTYAADSNIGRFVGKNSVRGNVSIRNQDQNAQRNTRGRFEATRVSTAPPPEAVTETEAG